MSFPSQAENPTGLHQRYIVSKANGQPVDNNADYLVFRIDDGGSDPLHIDAGRRAGLAYARAIAPHLPQVSADLFDRLAALGVKSPAHGTSNTIGTGEVFLLSNQLSFALLQADSEQRWDTACIGLIESVKTVAEKLNTLANRATPAPVLSLVEEAGPAAEVVGYHSTELSDISSIITWLHAQNKPMGELLRRFYNDATRGRAIKEYNDLNPLPATHV